ncbi:DNA-binding NarL/FixJ family response regulator [Microbacterium sp. SORGH_AS 969]|nr:DNA-binding NarL/FixJ family response regulator [Microbacterium sp. SORGH_AS_0969]
MIRVLIADDEDMIRTALAALLRLEPDLEVVGECRDGESAIAEAERLRPDVCLLDLEMPGLDGVDTAARILRRVPSRCVIVTRHARPGVLRRALGAGVDGFLPKSRPADDVAAVIREVAAGRRYVDPEIAADAR